MAARSTNDEWVLGYVRSGLGITVMPACFQSAGVVLPRLAGFEATRTIGLRLSPDSASRVRNSKTYVAVLEAVQILATSPTGVSTDR